ncbi:hypothetical protein MR547_10265, partial [bacterium]|nr:hypothetical protein [bacterium]
KAKTAWQVHKENRSRCCRTYKAAEKKAFLSYVESHFCGDDKWSLDACVGYLVLCRLQDCGIRLRTAEQNLQLELYFIGLEHRLANRAVLKGRCVPWR